VDRPTAGPLQPRDLGALSDDPLVDSGFILPDPEERFTVDDTDILPEDWVELRKDGTPTVRRSSRPWLPRRVYVVQDGACNEVGGSGAMAAWFVPAPFRFCLACHVSYASTVRSDFGKLASLSTEGRSTATTVLSLAIVQALRAAEGLPPRARKLLSFTDNRQDASLQAGHFNDFIQLGLLRAALYAAVAAAEEEGLTHEMIAQAVTAQLGLDFAEYSANPEARFLAKAKIESALRDAVGYRIYRDQERGWRVTAPNLEQVGLLRVRYDALHELCAAEDVWRGRHNMLAAATPRERAQACAVVLDTLRRELAIKVHYLDPQQQERLLHNSFQYLREPWALEDDEMKQAPVVRVGPRTHRGEIGVSATSGLGHYLRRPSTWRSSLITGDKLAAAELEPLAHDLFDALVIGGQLAVIDDGKGKGGRTYRLQAGCIRWLAGDGAPPAPDPTRVSRAAVVENESNRFFRDFYTHLALSLRGTEAREHTAQVPAAVREERERRFREGTLPVLYCSPTMELGVDIPDLNAVNLRNVPPTPANYAQRSGRAGRSGQPALVLTYCSSNSPHDQYFFATLPARASSPATTSRACRWRPTCRGGRAVWGETSLSRGRASWPSQSLGPAPSSTTRAAATA
jgi:Helicase conserved C-terminal domain